MKFLQQFFTRNKLNILICFTGGVFIITRLVALKQYNLNGDELFTLHASMLPVSDLVQKYATDFHSPAYALLLKLFSTFLDDPIFAGRILSVVLSIADCIISFYIVKFLFNSKQIAFISTILLCISPYLISWNMDIRWYSLHKTTTLFSVLGYLLVSKSATMPSTTKLCVFGLSLGLAAIGDYSGTITSTILFVMFVFQSSKNNKLLFTTLIVFFVALVISSPFIPSAISSLLNSLSQLGSQFLTDRLPAKNLFLKLGYVPFVVAAGQNIFPTEFFLTIPLIASLLGIVSLATFSKNFPSRIVHMVTIGTSLAAPVGILSLSGLAHPAYFQFFYIFYVICSLLLLTNLSQKYSPKSIIGIMLVTIFVTVQLIGTVRFFSEVKVTRTGRTVNYASLQQNISHRYPNSTIVTNSSVLNYYFSNSHLPHLNMIKVKKDTKVTSQLNNFSSKSLNCDSPIIFIMEQDSQKMSDNLESEIKLKFNIHERHSFFKESFYDAKKKFLNIELAKFRIRLYEAFPVKCERMSAEE